jgi:putative ABC transport system substrate-binding protein
MGNVREFAIDGGLLSYGPDSAVSFLRAANFVGRIAKGAKAGDLAVERATVLELCVNLRTAAAIGVTLPTALLARADDVLR